MEDSASDLKKLDDKVNKFIKDNPDYFHKGLQITEHEINSAISVLGREVNLLEKTPLYKEFLKIHGSISGLGFCMCGTLDANTDQEYKDNCLKYLQTSYDYHFKVWGLKDKLKNIWTVAAYGQDIYYIDSSRRGKGHIYCLEPDGRSTFFAENFLDFLDKVYKLVIYEHFDASEDDEFDSDV